MYKNDKPHDDSNFWISYADLMAGLLFVFILLVGAIVVRYVFVQQDLAQKQAALGKSEILRNSQNAQIKKFQERLKVAAENYAKEHQRTLSLNEKLSLKSKDIDKLKELLMGYELKNSTLEENMTAMQDRVSDIQQALLENKNILVLKNEELEVLGAKLLEESKAHQMLVDELNITKVKIKNLTGIRIKVVDTLRNVLGNSIMIDPKSGAIAFSSNILFNTGEFHLKPEAKKELSAIIKRYIHTLLFNDEIKPYIEGITIEGHTDSDGTYLYNLALSQKRALEVMKFLYEEDPQNRALYRRYLSASGRAYADIMVDENGDEDKEASRRIEIKFRLKNEEAVKELENFLNK